MAVEFRYANLDEYPRISEFLNEYWAKNHIYTRDRTLFDWSFHRAGPLGSRIPTAFRWPWTAGACRNPGWNSFHAESVRQVIESGLDRELRDPPGPPQGRHGAAASEFFSQAGIFGGRGVWNQSRYGGDLSSAARAGVAGNSAPFSGDARTKANAWPAR